MLSKRDLKNKANLNDIVERADAAIEVVNEVVEGTDTEIEYKGDKELNDPPRKNQHQGQPFHEELGNNKVSDADSTDLSYTDTGSGWIPMIASVKKESVWARPLELHDSNSQEFGPSDQGINNAITRNRQDQKLKYKHNVTDWDEDYKVSPNVTRKNELNLKDLDEKVTPKKIIPKKSEGQNKMKNLKKFAEKRNKVKENREKRLSSIYTMEEDYAAYGRYCAKNTCVGVWKELLGYDAKLKLGIERVSEVWRCPNCDEITSAHGSVSEQTSGFGAFNTTIPNKDVSAPKVDEDVERTKR